MATTNSTAHNSATPDLPTPELGAILAVQGCGSCGALEAAGDKPLRHCMKCNLQLYCSKECQKEHWKIHKATCKKPTVMPSGYRTSFNATTNDSDDLYAIRLGVVVAPCPAPASNSNGTNRGAAFCPSPLEFDQDDIRRQPSYLLPVSQAVGFPLRIIGCPSGELEIANHHIECLMLDVDLSSPAFGQPNWGPNRPFGTAMVVRADLKPLHFNQVKALAEFCYMFVQMFKYFVHEGVTGKDGRRMNVSAGDEIPQPSRLQKIL